jgi:hypothetical protein
LSIQFDDARWTGDVSALFTYKVDGEPAAAYLGAQIAKWPADG